MVDDINILKDYKEIWRRISSHKILNFEYREDGVYEDYLNDGCCPYHLDETWRKVFEIWFLWQLQNRLKVDAPIISLDIGSHTGKWTNFLANFSDKVMCADVYEESEKIIRLRHEGFMKSNNKELDFKLINGKNLDVFEDESMGFIWSVDSMTRLGTLEITDYVEDIARVLKPGGLAILHIPRHDKAQTSSVPGLDFPKFDVCHMTAVLPRKIWADMRVKIEFSGAISKRRSIPVFQWDPYKKIVGATSEINIMVSQYGGPGVIELPGFGQFMMIEKPKIK